MPVAFQREICFLCHEMSLVPLELHGPKKKKSQLIISPKESLAKMCAVNRTVVLFQKPIDERLQERMMKGSTDISAGFYMLPLLPIENVDQVNRHSIN